MFKIKLGSLYVFAYNDPILNGYQEVVNIKKEKLPIK